MRIKSFLIFSFIFGTLIPFLIFGIWLYYGNFHRELSRIEDRHLLLAHNLELSLSRYHSDLSAGISSLFGSLHTLERPDNLYDTLTSLHLSNVFLLRESTGDLFQLSDLDSSILSTDISADIIQTARDYAVSDRLTFTPVLSAFGVNVFLGVRHYPDSLGIAIITTDYFTELGSSISFGERGRAMILDNMGSVLYHSDSSWRFSRKNLSYLPIVNDLLLGESGIRRFRSPDLFVDMIGGIALVSGPGWGILVSQPLSELYFRSVIHSEGFFLALCIGVLLTMGLMISFICSLSRPFDDFLSKMRDQLTKRTLEPVMISRGILPLREVYEIGVVYNSLVDQISRAKSKIEKIAFHDELTGLPNRSHLLELSQAALTYSISGSRSYNSFSFFSGGLFVFIDLDDFKDINDTHGHALGDEYLCDTARRLCSVVDRTFQFHNFSRYDIPSPVVARIGGDEFAILFPGILSDFDAHTFLSDLQHNLSEPCLSLSSESRPRASIGAARYPHDADKLDDLMRLSDISMYHAKRMGKGCFQLYSKRIGSLELGSFADAA